MADEHLSTDPRIAASQIKLNGVSASEVDLDDATVRVEYVHALLCVLEAAIGAEERPTTPLLQSAARGIADMAMQAFTSLCIGHNDLLRRVA